LVSGGHLCRAGGQEIRARGCGKILKLGKVSGQEAYEAVRQVVPHDNESQIKGSTPLYMSLAEVLDGLGLVDDPDAVPLTVEKNGIQETTILKPEEAKFQTCNSYFLPNGSTLAILRVLSLSG
jgi:hypothetical protein